MYKGHQLKWLLLLLAVRSLSRPLYPDVLCCLLSRLPSTPVTDHPWPGFVYEQSWKFFNDEQKRQKLQGRDTSQPPQTSNVGSTHTQPPSILMTLLCAAVCVLSLVYC
jgi:hypothetical protein